MAARRSKLRTSTNPRRAWDVGRLQLALKGSGMDTRYWVGYGTVAVVGDDGEPDFTDQQAVAIGPGGVFVDVVLQPSNIPITCRYLGVAGGPHGNIMYPIGPGDMVLVLLPEGELGVGPVCLPAMSTEADKLPLGPDGKPLFKNDRILIQANDVPIEIVTKGGAKVLLNQAGDVTAESVGEAKVSLLANGTAKVESPSGSMTLENTQATLKGTTLTKLGDGPLAPILQGVLTGETIEPILGVPFSVLGQGSTVVLAKK